MAKQLLIIILLSLTLLTGVGSAEEDEEEINLPEEEITLPGVTVYGDKDKGKRKELLDDSPRISTHTLDQEEIIKPAGMLDDLFRVIQTLPGVVAEGDFSSVMYIRGGDIVETLTILDGAPMFNPYHMGVFSIFNNDLIEDVDFYAGGFPAMYPNALSGVLDVHYREGRRARVYSMGDISLISAKARVEGPYLNRRGSYLLSVRRTYYDLILMAIDKAGYVDIKEVAVPSFGDAYSKFVLDVGFKHIFTLSLLYSDDHLKIEEFEDPMRPDAPPWEIKITDSLYLLSLSWDYDALSNLKFDSNISYTGIDFEGGIVGTNPFDASASAEGLTVSTGFSLSIFSSNTLEGGVQFNRTEVSLKTLMPDFRSLTYGGNYMGPLNLTKIIINPEKEFYYTGFFLQDQWKLIPDKFTALVGTRADYWDDIEEWTVSPRLNLSYNINKETVLKGAWGVFHQVPENIIFTDEEFGNPNLKSRRSIHYIIGIERLFGKNHLLRFETYYKDLDFLVANYDDRELILRELILRNLRTLLRNFIMDEDAQVFTSEGIRNFILDEDVQIFTSEGKGHSYGAEVFLQRKSGLRLDGWITYGYGITKHYNPMATVNPKWFYPRQDQRHTLSIVLNYKLSELWSLACKFQFFSGKPYTPVDENTWRIEKDKRDPDMIDPGEVYVADFGHINSERLPPYHSLNLKVERKFNIKGLEMLAYFEVLNAYYHRNTYIYIYKEGDVKKSIPPKRESIYSLPIIPYFGMRGEF